MTLTKEFASKLAVAFVAAAMVVSAFAPAAQAQSTEDLQQMINDLLAQIAGLQTQVGGSSAVAAGVCPYTWTRSLSTGTEGADVKTLQEFLNSDADTRVGVSGAGSAGLETMYYGPATAAAVSKFQVKYRSDVLSPANLVNPTGFFGPSSIGKANALCVAAPVVVVEEEEEEEEVVDEEEDEEDEEDGDLEGEADIDSFDTDSASDDELEEGVEDAEVMEISVEFQNGDAEISRIDIAFESNDVTESDPWDTFETVSLWVDGDKVAEKNVDDEDDYLDEDDGSLRFSGLDLIAREDDEVEIVVAVTVQNSVDGTADGNAWTVEVDALRFFDADGVATTDVTTGDLGDLVGEAFTIEEEGADDELIAKTSSNDPDGSTLQVEDDSKSDWYNVFTFDLDTDDSENDIELNTVVVNVLTVQNTTATDAGFNDLVDDAELVIDGVTIDDFTVAGAGTTTAGTVTLTFDVDGDVTIDAGDRVEAELMLRFKSLPVAEEGATVKGSITSLSTTTVDAEGADDLGDLQLSGAATGDVHTLRTAGADVSADTVSAVVTAGDSAGDDYATYVIELEVTAFEQDVYISTNVATSTALQVEDAAGVVVAGTSSIVVESTGDETAGAFEITEGSTETITVTVTFDATSAGATARLNLNTLTFADTAIKATNASTADDQSWTASPDEDYRTAVVTLVN